MAKRFKEYKTKWENKQSQKIEKSLCKIRTKLVMSSQLCFDLFRHKSNSQLTMVPRRHYVCQWRVKQPLPLTDHCSVPEFSRVVIVSSFRGPWPVTLDAIFLNKAWIKAALYASWWRIRSNNSIQLLQITNLPFVMLVKPNLCDFP